MRRGFHLSPENKEEKEKENKEFETRAMEAFRQTQDSRLRFALPSVQTAFLHNDAIIYSFTTWVNKKFTA
jgi:hypothetical protein